MTPTTMQSFQFSLCIIIFNLVIYQSFLHHTYQAIKNQHHIRNALFSTKVSPTASVELNKKSNFSNFNSAPTATIPPTSFTSPDIVSTNNKLPLPFFDIDQIGFKGEWYEKSGNYILKPSKQWYASRVSSSSEKSNDTIKPLGVIHFLGGAFVGAAPHLAYKYLLESLANAGYIIVATPYRINMDYVKICDQVLEKFDGVGYELASEYGALPVIGLGHSCGALLQTLITSLFPDTPRALNILISYNNKPANKAIPVYQELVIPLSEQFVTNNNFRNLKSLLQTTRSNFEFLFKEISQSQFTPLFVQNEMYPLYMQSVEFADQFVPLLETIGAGAQEFSPSPADTKETCRRMYRARKTLLLKFNNDALDESMEIEKVLREANTIMRMKRPMVEMEVELRILDGTHITPLTQNILDPPAILSKNEQLMRLDLLKSFREKQKENFLKTINQVNGEILSFLNKNLI